MAIMAYKIRKHNRFRSSFEQFDDFMPFPHFSVRQLQGNSRPGNLCAMVPKDMLSHTDAYIAWLQGKIREDNSSSGWGLQDLNILRMDLVWFFLNLHMIEALKQRPLSNQETTNVELRIKFCIHKHRCRFPQFGNFWNIFIQTKWDLLR